MILLNNPLPSLDATEKLAGHLATFLRVGDVVALRGPLGAGKTAFARALLRSLGVTGDVPSPTFTLLQNYDTQFGAIAHFDLYRLKSEWELEELGWEDACVDSLVVVEWPERGGSRMPQDCLMVDFTVDDKGLRHAVLQPKGEWVERLKGRT